MSNLLTFLLFFPSLFILQFIFAEMLRRRESKELLKLSKEHEAYLRNKEPQQ